MCDALVELYSRTKALIADLPKLEYEQLELFVTYRGETVEQLCGAVLSKEEKQLVHVLIGFDEVILNRMIELRMEAEREMKKLQQSRLQKKMYNNSEMTPPSYFIDSRK